MPRRPLQQNKKEQSIKREPPVSNQENAQKTGGDFVRPPSPEKARAAPSTETFQNEILNDPRLLHNTAGDLRSQYMDFLQGTQGNAHIQRALRGSGDETASVQRQSESFPILSWLDRQRHNVMEATGLETTEEAERGRATAFYAHGTYGPETVIGAGGKGGFDVTYDPVSGVETVTIKGGVQFVDGLTDDGTTVTPQSGKLQGAANQAMALTGPDRAAFVAGYQWTEGERTPWIERLTSVVQTMWGSASTGLSFFINKPEWDWITAHVNVVVNIRPMEAGDSRADDDHLLITSVKEPAGSSETGAEVGPGTGDSAFDQTMTIASTDIDPRTDNMLLLNNTVTFDHDSVELSGDAKSNLDTWIATYQGAPTNTASNPTQVTIQGFTSASGSEEYNLDLGMRRVEAVREYLRTHGFTNIDSRVTEISFGESGADPSATAAEQERERRVELIVDSGDAQVVAAHEFGHAFGLGDEYAVGAGSAIRGTGEVAGTAAAHDQLTREMTDESGAALPGAIHENNESIMSLGNTVRPQHYSTFHKALKQVTGVNEWSVRS